MHIFYKYIINVLHDQHLKKEDLDKNFKLESDKDAIPYRREEKLSILYIVGYFKNVLDSKVI